MFEKQVSYFEKQFKVLCWDAPAHGKSRPYVNFTYHSAAKHLKDILEKEHIKKAVFIGQSMGGYIIQTFLKQYEEFAIGFVGIDTAPFQRKIVAIQQGLWHFVKFIVRNNNSPLTKKYAAAFTTDDF
ncbi:MAG: alpha/beta fold hydrolase [Lachnospiraceae bacterium]|nr:alpha/beta fold hydrolase [Lachnospiraceae bacterium]